MLPTKSELNSYAIAYDEKAVKFIEESIIGRMRMYENCYEHEAKIASETMLMNALREFVEEHESLSLEDLLALTDDELLAVILAGSPSGSPARKLVELLMRQQHFVRLIEPIPLYEQVRGYESIECDTYMNAVGRRDHAKLAYEIPLQWQESLTRTFPEEIRWMVEVYATPHDRCEIKEQSIQIIREKGESFEYLRFTNMDSVKETTSFLADHTLRNPKIEVFVYNELPKSRLTEAKEICGEIWGSKKASKKS